MDQQNFSVAIIHIVKKIQLKLLLIRHFFKVIVPLQKRNNLT